MVPVKPTVKPPPTSKPPPKPLASAKPQVCNIYAAPSSVSARTPSSNPRSTGLSRPNISAPAAKPKPPSAEPVSAAERNGGSTDAAKEEVKEEVGSSVGTKEAAAKAAKELETRLAKLGSSISKADAMAVAEKADTLAAACSLHVDSVPATGRFHFRSLLTRLDTQTKELRSLNVSKAADTSKLVKDLQATVKELGTAIQR